MMFYFRGSCDWLRQTIAGEFAWQDMMSSREEISEEEFIKKVDISQMLDKGESWLIYKENIENQIGKITFYKSNNDIYHLQHTGFEFIFSPHPLRSTKQPRTDPSAR